MSSETLSSTSLRVRPSSPEVKKAASNTDVGEKPSELTQARERLRSRDADKSVPDRVRPPPVKTPERVKSPLTSTTSKTEERAKSPVTTSSTEERVRPSIPAPTPEDRQVKSPTTTEPDQVKSPVTTKDDAKQTLSGETAPRVLSPVTIKQDVISTDKEKKEKETVATCRYDGVDMPALDLENYEMGLRRNRPPTNKSLEDLAEQSYSYSDNEKQLLEEMKRMQQEHEAAVSAYEEKITELMCTMKDLRQLADELARSKSSNSANKFDTAGIVFLTY